MFHLLYFKPILLYFLRFKINKNKMASNLEEKPKFKYNEKGYPLDQKTGEVLRPCCVCLDVKYERDNCFIEKGQENCTKEMGAFKQCMRDLGFKGYD